MSPLQFPGKILYGQAMPKKPSQTRLLNIPTQQCKQTETTVQIIPKCLRPMHLISCLQLHTSAKSRDRDNEPVEISVVEIGSISHFQLTCSFITYLLTKCPEDH